MQRFYDQLVERIDAETDEKKKWDEEKRNHDMREQLKAEIRAEMSKAASSDNDVHMG